MLMYRYSEQFSAGFAAFAPDMSIFIQEQQRGSMHDELYRVDHGGRMERFFATYQRVRSPSWSPDGHTIAFAGTETIPDPRTNLFTALVGIGDVVFYPWDLYLVSVDGKDVRVILSGIKDLNIIKWSPRGDRLAFRGEYKDKRGIWVLDMVSSRLTRVWSELDFYDWSPDGKQMVVLQQIEQNGLKSSHPLLIDVPSSDQ
jgi:Tol biopolymer transport system component